MTTIRTPWMRCSSYLIKGGNQRSSEVIRGRQRPPDVIRGHQGPLEVIRGHQGPFEVIRGHQRSSEVIRGHPSYERSEPKTERTMWTTEGQRSGA